MGELDLAQVRTRDPAAAEASLLAGLREHSPEACAELYDRFALRIHRFAATRLAGDVGTAEDVVVETMAWGVRDIRRFDPRRSTLAAWVYGIARRRVMLEIRGRKRLKSVPAEAQVSADEIGDLSGGVDVAEETTARLEARTKVAALRRVLSQMEFDVLVLSCVEELSAREVAQVIGRSERAVHSILHRARKKARGRLVGDE